MRIKEETGKIKSSDASRAISCEKLNKIFFGKKKLFPRKQFFLLRKGGKGGGGGQNLEGYKENFFSQKKGGLGRAFGPPKPPLGKKKSKKKAR